MKTPNKDKSITKDPEGTVWVLVPEKIKGTLDQFDWLPKLVNAEEAEMQLSLPNEQRNHHWKHVKYKDTQPV